MSMKMKKSTIGMTPAKTGRVLPGRTKGVSDVDPAGPGTSSGSSGIGKSLGALLDRTKGFFSTVKR